MADACQMEGDMQSNARVTMDVFRPEESPEKDEWTLRRELAAAYRIFDYFGWTLLIYGHPVAP